jgi:mono/diheme cytochrome c family protein
VKSKAFVLMGALILGGCAPEDWGPDALSRGTGDIDDETLVLGKASYELYCVGCHGVEGDGNGPAAKRLNPKPRDFRIGKLKFASVASGEMPHDEDFMRVLAIGLKGSAMPSFRFVPERERIAIVKYLRTMYTGKPKAPGTTVSIPKDPWAKKPEKGVAYGERMYHGLAACSSCHPAYAAKPDIAKAIESFDMKFQGFRDNMYASEVKDSDWGAPIKPPDFLYDWIKTGNDKESIVRVIAAGIGGTAMPNWAATLNAKQLWSLAYYVERLASVRGQPAGTALQQQLANQPPFEPPKPPPPPEPEPTDEGAGGGAEDGADAAGTGGATAKDSNTTEEKK